MELVPLRERQTRAALPGALPPPPEPQARRVRPRTPVVRTRRHSAHRGKRPFRVAASPGLGNRDLGAGHDSRRVLPGCAPDGPARGESQGAPQATGKGLPKVARLGAALRLPDGRGLDLRARVRALLADLRLDEDGLRWGS